MISNCLSSLSSYNEELLHEYHISKRYQSFRIKAYLLQSSFEY